MVDSGGLMHKRQAERKLRQAERKLRLEERRRERRERAIQTIREGEEPDQIEIAQQILVELDLEERIDLLKQELDDMRDRHRERKRQLRNERPRREISPEERQKNRERYKKARKHEEESIKIIKAILNDHDRENESKTISYTEVARILTEEFKHKTIYGKKWTNASVKRLIERDNKRHKYGRIGHENDKQKAANDKRARMVDEYALLFREKYLPLIDQSQNPFAISKELNRLKVPNRKEAEAGKDHGEGKWGNMTVTRLLRKIHELEFAIKFRDGELSQIDTSQNYEKIAKDLNNLQILDYEGFAGRWNIKSVRELLKKIHLLSSI